ncbi:MAG: hypothetical protein Q4G68_07700 [Planctomycetia bacterium]|nr:hypothetical protein [Planctomycetia bacterium]
MKKRLLAISILLTALLLPALSGCSLFKGTKKEAPDAEKTVFEEQRSEQDNLAAFVASAGRANPKEKKEASPGQTFLLSSKAKEIYNNTER